jgi:hypothetical protein
MMEELKQSDVQLTQTGLETIRFFMKKKPPVPVNEPEPFDFTPPPGYKRPRWRFRLFKNDNITKIHYRRFLNQRTM